MALMTVNDDDTDDPRGKPRWSAGKKLDVVLRLLRGEKLDALSRELGWRPIASPPGATTSSRAARRRSRAAGDR